MQSKDITVGADYAYYSHLSKYGAHSLVGTDRPDRVKVVSPPSGGRVEIAFYARPTSKRVASSYGTRIVPVKNILATWEDHAERKDTAETRRNDEIGRIQAAVKTIHRLLGGKKAAVKHIGYTHGFDGVVYADGSYATGGTITVEALADMLQAAYDKGVADTKAQGQA